MTRELSQNNDYTELSLSKQDYAERSLIRMRLNDCTFELCDFSNTELGSSTFISTTFNECNLTGAFLTKSQLQNCTFNNCKVLLSSLMFSKLENVRFVNCHIQDLDLRDTVLERLKFTDCTIEDLDLQNAIITKGLDISESDLVSIKDITNLKGLKINNAQLMQLAPYLASELGIIVTNS